MIDDQLPFTAICNVFIIGLNLTAKKKKLKMKTKQNKVTHPKANNNLHNSL